MTRRGNLRLTSTGRLPKERERLHKAPQGNNNWNAKPQPPTPVSPQRPQDLPHLQESLQEPCPREEARQWSSLQTIPLHGKLYNKYPRKTIEKKFWTRVNTFHQLCYFVILPKFPPHPHWRDDSEQVLSSWEKRYWPVYCAILWLATVLDWWTSHPFPHRLTSPWL